MEDIIQSDGLNYLREAHEYLEFIGELRNQDVTLNQPNACLEAFTHLADKAQGHISQVIAWIEGETKNGETS